MVHLLGPMVHDKLRNFKVVCCLLCQTSSSYGDAGPWSGP